MEIALVGMLAVIALTAIAGQAKTFEQTPALLEAVRQSLDLKLRGGNEAKLGRISKADALFPALLRAIQLSFVTLVLKHKADQIRDLLGATWTEMPKMDRGGAASLDELDA
jgi:hypothetical protein